MTEQKGMHIRNENAIKSSTGECRNLAAVGSGAL